VDEELGTTLPTEDVVLTCVLTFEIYGISGAVTGETGDTDDVGMGGFSYFVITT
jgi:hypothetical protein